MMTELDSVRPPAPPVTVPPTFVRSTLFAKAANGRASARTASITILLTIYVLPPRKVPNHWPPGDETIWEHRSSCEKKSPQYTHSDLSIQYAKEEKYQPSSYHAFTHGNVTSLILKVQSTAHEYNFPSRDSKKGAPVMSSAP